MQFKTVLLSLLLLVWTAAGAAEVTNATSVAFGFCPSGGAAAAADSAVYGFVAAGLATAATDSPAFGYVAPGLVATEAASSAFGYVLPGEGVATSSSSAFAYSLPGAALSASSSASFAYVVPGTSVATASSAASIYYPAGTVLASASSEPFEFGETVCAALKGSIAWKFNLLTGCCTAQLKLTCTNGFESGLSKLRFLYEDRCVGTKIKSALWDSSTDSYRPSVRIDGTTYRFVELDASKLVREGSTAVYGVKAIPPSVGFIPSEQRQIEIWTLTPYDLISDIGYVTWESGGQNWAIPVSAADGVQGWIVRDVRAVMKIVAAMTFHKPLSLSRLNLALAIGVPLEEEEQPFCDMSAFSFGPSGLSGRIETGKKTAQGVRTKGALGSNARVVLTGAKSLGEGFADIGTVEVDEKGDFTMPSAAEEYKFFKLRLDVESAVE